MSQPGLPLVTVATPTYQRAAFLPETIESLLAQTYDNIEYIVVDDGSSDDTRRVVEGYIQRFGDRIRYVWQENGGEASATNHAWRLARGKYFCVVCSDDPQPPKLIERSVDFMENNPSVLVSYPDWTMIDERSQPMFVTKADEYSLARLLGDAYNFIGPGALIRREAIVGAQPFLRDPSYRLLSDLECWLRLAPLGEFRRIPEVLACWRKHSVQGCSAANGPRFAQEYSRLLEDYFSRPNLPPEARQLERRARASFMTTAAGWVGRRRTMLWTKYQLLALVHETPQHLVHRVINRIGHDISRFILRQKPLV